MSSRAAKTARDPLGTSELRRGGDSSASSRLRMTPIRDLGRLLILLGGVLLLAGIAWAQHTGVDKVEVRVDHGQWREARLGDEDTIDTWRQWVYEWDAQGGAHTIQVRATDKTGYTQTSEEASPVPDGATGWHTITVSVAEET